MYDVMERTRSAAEWEAEDRLAWELTEAALASPVVAEPPFVPVGIESWPADERLAVFLSRIDPDALSGSDRVRYMAQMDRLVAAGHGRFRGAVGSVADAYDGLAEDIEDPEIRHRTGWTFERLPNGDYLGTSPLGGQYTIRGTDPPA